MCSLLKVQFINVFILHFYLPVLAFSSLGKIQSYVMLNHFKMKIWAANIDNYNIWFEFHHTICKADQEWLLEVASPPLLIPPFFAIFLKFCLPIKKSLSILHQTEIHAEMTRGSYCRIFQLHISSPSCTSVLAVTSYPISRNLSYGTTRRFRTINFFLIQI